MLRGILAALLVTAPAVAQQSIPMLMPLPHSVEMTAARFRLDSSLTVAFQGHRDDRLERGVLRAMHRLEARLAQPLSRSFGNPTNSPGDRCRRDRIHRARSEENESYRLVLPLTNHLAAPTVVGALRGIELCCNCSRRMPRDFLPGTEIPTPSIQVARRVGRCGAPLSSTTGDQADSRWHGGHQVERAALHLSDDQGSGGESPSLAFTSSVRRNYTPRTKFATSSPMPRSRIRGARV